MKAFRFTLSALLFGASAALMSCGDSAPVGPRPSSVVLQADRKGSEGQQNGQNTDVLECSPLPSFSAVQTIGPEGGVMHVGPHTFTVPAGALSEAVTITAVAPSEQVAHIRFSPEGLRFSRSASLTMSYAHCKLGSLLPRRITYTSADLTTLFYDLPSVDDAPGKKVTGKVDHFSDYAVAW
jgi:hypothetical protein